MNKNLSLKQLKAFLAIAATGSFTEAAKSLHLTQSAISVLIRDLEQEFRLQLFDRTTRKVTLTEAGRELLPEAQTLFNDLSLMVDRMEDLRQNRRGSLRVAAPQLMACTLMPKLLSTWMAGRPDVEVVLRDTLPERLLRVLLDGEVELAIGPDRLAELNSGDHAKDIAIVPLLRDRHMLVCPSTHPLAKKKEASWAEMAQWPYIAPTLDSYSRLLPELLAFSGKSGNGPLLKPAYQVSYITTAIGMVANGMGLTACPTYAKALVRAHGLKMIPLVDPVFHREVFIYYLAKKSLSPAAESFVQTVKSGWPRT